jgi:hypothetical protein
MEFIKDNLVLFIPIIVIQLTLMVAALIDWAKRPHTRGSKWLWLAIILLVQWIGPIAYFVYGREEA